MNTNEVQERIVSKARELFMRYGIRSVSMDDVANQLGISKKTIYQFYTDKDTLVEDVIEIELDSNEHDCRLHKRHSDNAVHEVFLAMDMVRELLSKMNPTLIYDLEKFHPKAYKKYSDYKNKFLYDIIRANLEAGKQEGLYRDEIQTDIMTRFRLASIFLMFNPEVFPLGRHSLADVVTEVTGNFLFGLTTSKGHKLVQKYRQQRLKTIDA